MNKLILSLLVSAAAMAPLPVFAILHAQFNEEQKTAIQEYFQKRKEENAERAKQLFDLIVQIVPEFYLAELMLEPVACLKSIELMCATEELICMIVEKHPELQAILEKYYDNENCEYCFNEGFNAVFSWEHFKIFYMYTMASLAKDANFRKVNLEAAQAEAIPFADYLIGLKNS